MDTQSNNGPGRDHSAPIIQAFRPKPPGSARNVRRAIVTVAVSAAALLTLYLALKPKDPDLLTEWTEAVAALGPIRELAQVSGSIEMSASRSVLSPEAGTLVRQLAAEGDWIGKGGALALISAPDLEDELLVAVSGLESARRDLAALDAERGFALERELIESARKQRAVLDAEAALERAKELERIGSGTAKETADRERALLEAREALSLDDISRRESEHGYRQQRESLTDKLASLEKTQADTRERLASLSVASPIAGRILAWSADEGSPVQRNGVLASVADTTRPVAVFAVAETTAARLSPGMEVSITVGTASYPGRVSAIGLEASASSDYGSTVRVTATFDGAIPEFASGATASGSIVLGSKESAVLLPRGPYLGTGAAYLFVIRDGKAVRVPAKFGSTENGMVEVLAGAAEGDRVIISDYSTFKDKESVTLGGER